MPKLIAFLRAINVGGHTVKMDQLRRLFAAAGLSQVETFIASGNVVFESGEPDLQSLQRRLEQHLAAELGFPVAAFIRTSDELLAIAAFPSFSSADLEQAAAFNVAFLHNPPSQTAAQRLMALRTDIDDFHVGGREVYWLCRKRQSESAFSNAVLEKTLGQQATLRGMNTVRKIADRWS